MQTRLIAADILIDGEKIVAYSQQDLQHRTNAVDKCPGEICTARWGRCACAFGFTYVQYSIV